MSIALNHTHDPARKSWVASANDPGTDFPLQNLPLGLFRGPNGAPRPCTAIGDQVLDIRAAIDAALLTGPAAEAAQLACAGDTLNMLIADGHAPASALRAGLFALLAADHPPAPHLLRPQSATEMLLPAEIGGFTDFFCSLPHTERMGRQTRPDRPVPPAFKHLPLAYNSRASTVRVSGTPLRRPHVHHGLIDGKPSFGPCEALDYEMELGAFLIGGNNLGEPLTMQQAADQVFGYVLLNDWSARDIQRFESLPLGPFLAKTMLTSISPWIVTAEAIAPFRRPAPSRSESDPPPLPHLDSAENRAHGAIALTLESRIHTQKARDQNAPPHLLARTQFEQMYWTIPQMIAHHASNGCTLRPGDLIGSGTTSDTSPLGRACLGECSPDGPIHLPTGETRTYLDNNDSLTLTAHAHAPSHTTIGFGRCEGRVWGD